MPKYSPKIKSHESFLRDVDDFCIYTIKLLKREDVCPKSARWLGAYEIVRITQQFHTAVHRANNTLVKGSAEAEQRRAKQVEAYSLLVTLGEKFAFCSRIYDMKADALPKWLTRKGEVQAWLSGWIRSDEKRYGKLTQ